MMITGERRSKTEMMKGLKPGFIKSKLIARNTIKAEYQGGTEIIRYMDTNVVTINPDKSITLNSGGYMTVTTKKRIEENTRLRILQKNSIWYIIRNIHNGYPMTTEGLPLFYDGITISESGEILTGLKISQDDTIKRFKKDLKKLADKITKENLDSYFAGDTMAGDCLICRFDMAKGSATSDHLISHVQEGYMHGSLMILCLKLSGYNPAPHIQMRFVDNIKRSVRKVISDTCIPIILNDPTAYPVKEVA